MCFSKTNVKRIQFKDVPSVREFSVENLAPKKTSLPSFISRKTALVPQTKRPLFLPQINTGSEQIEREIAYSTYERHKKKSEAFWKKTNLKYEDMEKVRIETEKGMAKLESDLAKLRLLKIRFDKQEKEFSKWVRRKIDKVDRQV